MTSEWVGTAWGGTAVAERKAETGPFVTHVQHGAYLLRNTRTPQAMMARAQVAYHRNPWVGSAEATVTRRVAGLPWHLEDDQDEEYEEPYPADVKLAWDLLERPQKAIPPEQRDPGLLTRRALVSLISRHLGLCGMAYVYLDSPDINGKPHALLYVNPARVWAAATKQGKITGWILDPTDEYGNGGTPLRLDELLPFYLDPPDSGPYGTGLYERAMALAQITDLADQHAAYVLGTGGRLAGIVSPKEGTIPDEQYTVLVREFRNVNEAPDAAKRTTILRGPIDFTQTAASPKDLNLDTLNASNRDNIFAVWGVPPRMAGIPSAAGLNSGETAKQDEAILMQGPVHDRVVSIRETFQFGLLDRWQDTGTTIDLEIEEPEYDDRAPMYELAKSAVDQPLKNMERRELVGLPPFGEKVLGPSGGPLDEEVWLPALSTLAYSASQANIPPVVSITSPQLPQLAPTTGTSGMPMAVKASREFLGLRKSVDTRWVPRVRRTVSDVLRAQRSDVAAKVRAASPDEIARHRKDAPYWLTTGKEADRLAKLLTPLLASLAETVGKRTGDLLAPKKADPFADKVASLIKRVGERITGITETTQRAVADAIAAGFDAGLSPAQIADTIETLPAFDEARAELVARTETMYAYNTAAIESYAEFGVSEVEAIDGDGDEVCAARDGQTYSIADAADIEDHPNGTLDWMPVLGKADTGEVDKVAALRDLRAAIKLHEAHMDGTEPTSPKSQRKLMDLMRSALTALGMAADDSMVKAILALAERQPITNIYQSPITVEASPAPVVYVDPPHLTFEAGAIQNTFEAPAKATRKVVEYDAKGRAVAITEEPDGP